MTNPASTAASPKALPAATRLGPVELTVTDLDRAVDFYRESIGLREHGRRDDTAELGAGGEDVLVLVENRDARPVGRQAGLYHVALLHPSRLELARALKRLVATRTPIQGASDHVTHEAIYLSDPDGNGLELAADRPREQWPNLTDTNLYAGGPQPLDVDGLLDLVAAEPPRHEADTGLGVGHVHLHVGDLDAAMRFYRDVVGFEPQMLLPSAGFVSAGGYHHHVAFNTWRGAGVPPATEDAVGMRHFTVFVPAAADVDAAARRIRAAGVEAEPRDAGLLVRDPSGNALLIAAEPAAR
jgi:catechol 2,3-dioxygenase